MIYTYILNRGGRGVRNPIDALLTNAYYTATDHCTKDLYRNCIIIGYALMTLHIKRRRAMYVRKFRLLSIVFAAIILAANLAWAMGFLLGETKEQLKLKYDVSLVDHDTGRVTVKLTIVDQGRLKPLDAVELVVPSKEKNKDGSSYFDLSVELAMRE